MHGAQRPTATPQAKPVFQFHRSAAEASRQPTDIRKRPHDEGVLIWACYSQMLSYCCSCDATRRCRAASTCDTGACVPAPFSRKPESCCDFHVPGGTRSKYARMHHALRARVDPE